MSSISRQSLCNIGLSRGFVASGPRIAAQPSAASSHCDNLARRRHQHSQRSRPASGTPQEDQRRWWHDILLLAPVLPCVGYSLSRQAQARRLGLRRTAVGSGSRLCNGYRIHSQAHVSSLAGVQQSRSRSSTARPAFDEEPRMSPDGGNEEEFEEYWSWYHRPKHYSGGWVERRAHPQLNVDPYWYNAKTDETVFERPASASEELDQPAEIEEAQKGEGPAWELSVKELRAALQAGPEELERLGLTDQELAKRAVYEYSSFTPRVLSWHDFQYNTFWFFISDRDKGKDRGKRVQGFFSKSASDNQRMFAHDSFFRATADCAMENLDKIHPINLVYMLWSFVRANVSAPQLFDAAGHYFCNGLIPSMDRCGLGTMVWAYSKARIRHQRFFDRAAEEYSRPVRARSLAPRNFQNTMLAYSWWGPGYEAMIERLAATLIRLLDNHDPRLPKLRNDLCFPYTCKDGAVVLADCYRIGGLNLFLRGLLTLNDRTDAAEACFEAIVNYNIKSAKRSPNWMRENGDIAYTMTLIAQAAAQGWPCAPRLLEKLEAESSLVRRGAKPHDLQRLDRALASANRVSTRN
eukprot:TRINITY_DN40501_c0_g1_i1.p1 TRINITY_DN40501_c0_g1~~TRINITY_DN40501_c0_g1_i1.p1  ORF type:complete len:578 (+),score=69.12 TRINITY_DN40501_c0_g1_i1:93-1826(+)